MHNYHHDDREMTFTLLTIGKPELQNPQPQQSSQCSDLHSTPVPMVKHWELEITITCKSMIYHINDIPCMSVIIYTTIALSNIHVTDNTIGSS